MTRSRAAGVDVVMLTALGLEYDAVRAHLTDIHSQIDADGTRYEIGTVRGGRSRVALALIGEGNLTAAALAGRAVEEFAPAALLLVGVAGGLSADVALGDVVVATRIHAYQGGRDEAGGFRPRPKGWPTSHGLEQVARDVARADDWTAPLAGEAAPLAGETGPRPPRVHFKPVVSGDVVLDSRTSPTAALIAEYYSDAVAIDMESAGVAEAAHRKEFHQTVTVRGISDPADGRKRDADASGWQHRAAAHAAAFAVAIAERIDQGPAGTARGPRRRRIEPAPACPFRGLAAFREQDADVFFGRAEVADELAETASRRRFVALVGRAGSGKSSLLHAGLVPRMRERGWAVAAFRPPPDVPAAAALAGGLLPLLQPGLTGVAALSQRAVLAEAITGGRLPELVGDALAATGTSRLLVCVDQFEEYVARSEPAARELADLLVRLSAGAPAAHVLLTLRTETLDVAVNRLGLGDAARNSVFLLTAMRPDQLRAAIEGPVVPTGVAFEPGLVERILEAAQDAPAALTLTQFGLTRLWEEQDAGLLTHAAYDAFGGVGGALASYAERVWADDLDDAERVRARRLLVQLVRPDGDDLDVVRRTARAGELEPNLVPVAHRLATNRLIVTGADAAGETTFDLAHAALARHWRRLGNWLSEEREFRVWQEDLREGMRRSEPLRGPRLVHALRWLREHPDGITRPERDFVTASRRRHRWRTAAWRGGLAAIVALLVLVSTFAVVLRQRTGELERQLGRNAAHLLVAQARERFRSDPDLAVLMSVAAFRSTSDPDVLAHLAGEYLRYRSTNRLFDPGVGEIIRVDLSADGRVAAALGAGGTAAIWRLDRPQIAPDRDERALTRIALSPDGRLLASSTGRGRIEVRQPDGTLTLLHDGGQGGGGATRLRFDAQSRRLLAVLPGQGLRLWDIPRGSAVAVPPDLARQFEEDRDPGGIWFGPDPDRLVVATKDALVEWHLPTAAATELTLLAGAGRATVSGDGRTAIVCVSEALGRSLPEPVLVSWDLAARRERNRRPALRSVCPDLFGDPIDHAGATLRIATGQEGGDEHPRRWMTLMDLATGVTAHPAVPSPTTDVQDRHPIATTEAGARLITSVGPTAVVVDVASAGFQPINRLRDRSPSPLFSKDLRLAVTTSTRPERVLALWDARTGRELARIANLDGIRPLHFSPDGRRLLARQAFTHLLVLDVPSLRILARLPLPAAPGVRPSNEMFLGPFNGLCVADLPTPDAIAVLFGGLISRFDLRGGTRAGPQLQPWRDQNDLARLATSIACSIRPGRSEIAFDADRRVEVWDVDRGSQVASLAVEGASRITDVRFSPDGRRLAVMGQDGSVEVWDVDRQRQIRSPQRVLKPSFRPTILDFSADNRIVVADTDLIQVWDLERRGAIANVDIPPGVGSPIVAADGGSILFFGEAGLIRVSLDPQVWAATLCRAVGRDVTAAERQTLPPGSPTGSVCPSA
ncbi:MAG TPA: hypothetical protein VFR67_24645 [Pilimelia sp.]|nr:hypothetical protein [Pilimelia sp.]